MFIRSFLAVSLAAAVSFAVAAPKMLVYGNEYVAIPSGQSQADSRTGTDLGRFTLPMAGDASTTFGIVNLGDENLVITHTFNFSGPKGSAYSVDSVDSTDLAPGAKAVMTLSFFADSNGQYSTELTLISNDPSMPNYIIPLRAQVGNNAPPTPDATVEALGEPLLVKYNEKKGYAKYSWNMQAYNLNDIAPQKGAVVRCWYSDDLYLEPTDTLMKQKTVKKFAPFDPETIKVVKLKLKVPAPSGYFFSEVLLMPEGSDETNYTNNIVVVPFSVYE